MSSDSCCYGGSGCMGRGWSMGGCRKYETQEEEGAGVVEG